MQLNIKGFYNFCPFYNVSPVKTSISGNYYFLSNDIIKYKKPNALEKIRLLLSKRNLRNKKSVGFKRYTQSSFVAIANIHSLHALSLLSKKNIFEKLVFIDYNVDQILHLRSCIADILASKNRIDFIQRFFCIKLNSNAINILNSVSFPPNYIHGEVDSDKYFDLEKNIWGNVSFDQINFEKKYNLNVNKTNCGLVIKAQTIGDINRYKATLFSCGRSEHEMNVFTISYGSGFLRSEEHFISIKNILKETQSIFIIDDITNIFEKILLTLRYKPICIWLSNLIQDYFINKNKNILSIKNYIIHHTLSKSLPDFEFTILQDERVKDWIPLLATEKNIYQRFLTSHTKTFSSIQDKIYGKTLEVTNMPTWIIEDQGTSKLNNTDYILSKNFLKLTKKYDSIFFHILLGHGEDLTLFFKYCNHAMQLTNNFLILEHNKNSKDFYDKKVGTTPQEIEKKLGKATAISYIPGEKSTDRNFMLQYVSEK